MEFGDFDHGLKPLSFKEIDQESELQQIVADDISVVDSRLMVIGREVMSNYGGRVDVLGNRRRRPLSCH